MFSRLPPGSQATVQQHENISPETCGNQTIANRQFSTVGNTPASVRVRRIHMPRNSTDLARFYEEKSRESKILCDSKHPRKSQPSSEKKRTESDLDHPIPEIPEAAIH